MYVEELIGPDTINTMPQPTLEAFIDHGRVARTIDAGVDTARQQLRELAEAGIDLARVTEELEHDGVAGFTKSYQHLLETMTRSAASARP